MRTKDQTVSLLRKHHGDHRKAGLALPDLLACGDDVFFSIIRPDGPWFKPSDDPDAMRWVKRGTTEWWVRACNMNTEKRPTCEDVRASLEAMLRSGEAWKGQRYAAEQLHCSKATVAKAIRQSDALASWTNTAAPVAVPLTGMVVDSAAQSREDDPSDSIPDDEVDALMSKLIDEAEPTERARLNNLDDDGRRMMAALYSSQSRDRGRCHKRV